MRPRGRGFGVKGSAHEVFWPDYNNRELGVLLGMIYGDGNLIKREEASRTGRWRIEFCEGDLALVKHYSLLTARLLNIQPTIRNRKTWHEAYYSSRIAYEFLTFAGEHPNGKKTGRLRLPCIARQGPSTMLGFLSGLFSVEGSVKIESNVRIAVEMLESILIQEIDRELQVMGYEPHVYDYPKDNKRMFGIYVYGVEECARFAKEIGLLGNRRRKLSRFLRSRGSAISSPRQPGGG